jgi:hypothetical protein
MRRVEISHHHHIAGAYLIRHAQESTSREDHRRVVRAGGHRRIGLAMAAPTSVDRRGYWQRGWVT